MKYSKETYINIGFTVFIFVIIWAFINDNILPSDSMGDAVISGLISGLIGGSIASLIAFLLRKKPLFLKILIILALIAFTAIY